MFTDTKSAILAAVAIYLGFQYSTIEVPNNFEKPHLFRIQYCFKTGLFFLVSNVTLIKKYFQFKLNFKVGETS